MITYATTNNGSEIPYYARYYYKFLASSEAIRNESKNHWIECHKRNIESNKPELYIFSAQILAMIALAEEALKKA